MSAPLESPLAGARAPSASGWSASLELSFEERGGRTSLARRRHRGPLVVQRAFHEPDGSCHVYLIHPPGGVVGGDELRTSVALQPGARALLTTPAATKLYRSAGATSRLVQELAIGADARLEWLPLETIAYAGCKVESSTRVALTGGAQFVGWEIVCLGHDAAGFTSGQLIQRWRIEREGRLLWQERTPLEASGPLSSARWGLAGRRVLGTFVATGAALEHVERLREHAPERALDWQSTTLLGEVLVCRYLGYSAEGAKRFFGEAWNLIRQHVSGRRAVAPRVWAT